MKFKDKIAQRTASFTKNSNELVTANLGNVDTVC